MKNYKDGYKKVGNYVLTNKLGSGNFGEVWKAFDEIKKDFVAVKIIKKSKINSNKIIETLFHSEVNIMSKLDNKNVVKFNQLIDFGQNYYIIMEYCNQGDLLKYLTKKKYLKEEEVVEVFKQLLNGFKCK